MPPFSSTGGGGRQDGGALDGERLKILEEREKWEKEKNEMQTERNQKDYQRAMASVDNGILDLLPKTKEAKQTCDLLNRVTMTFDVVLEKGNEVSGVLSLRLRGVCSGNHIRYF